MNSRYSVRLSSPALYQRGGLSNLELAAKLEQNLSQAKVLAQTPDGDGTPTFEVRMGRGDHHVALNEILAAAQLTGYSVVEAIVSEYTDSLVRGAVTGAVTGGGAGATTRDPGVAVMAGLLGALGGAVIGSLVPKLTAVYQVQRGYNGWVLTPVPVPDVQPGFGLA